VFADGFFQEAATGNTGNGTSNNTFAYVDQAGNTFNRRVNAFLNNITLDEQSGTLATTTRAHFPAFTQQSGLLGDVRLPGGRTAGLAHGV